MPHIGKPESPRIDSQHSFSSYKPLNMLDLPINNMMNRPDQSDSVKVTTIRNPSYPINERIRRPPLTLTPASRNVPPSTSYNRSGKHGMIDCDLSYRLDDYITTAPERFRAGSDPSLQQSKFPSNIGKRRSTLNQAQLCRSKQRQDTSVVNQNQEISPSGILTISEHDTQKDLGTSSKQSVTPPRGTKRKKEKSLIEPSTDLYEESDKRHVFLRLNALKLGLIKPPGGHDRKLSADAQYILRRRACRSALQSHNAKYKDNTSSEYWANLWKELLASVVLDENPLISQLNPNFRFLRPRNVDLDFPEQPGLNFDNVPLEQICLMKLKQAVSRINKFNKQQSDRGYAVPPQLMCYDDFDSVPDVQTEIIGNSTYAAKHMSYRERLRVSIYTDLLRGIIQVPVCSNVSLTADTQNILLSGTTDGTRVVHYPNGHPAIIQSYANRRSYYIILLDSRPKHVEGYFRGIITPSGSCTIYNTSGQLWYIHSGNVGIWFDSDSQIIKQKWDPASQASPCVKLKLNEYLQVNVQKGCLYQILLQANNNKVETITGRVKGQKAFTFNSLKELRTKYGYLTMPNCYCSMAARDHRPPIYNGRVNKIDETQPEGHTVMNEQANDIRLPGILLFKSRENSNTATCESIIRASDFDSNNKIDSRTTSQTKKLSTTPNEELKNLKRSSKKLIMHSRITSWLASATTQQLHQSSLKSVNKFSPQSSRTLITNSQPGSSRRRTEISSIMSVLQSSDPVKRSVKGLAHVSENQMATSKLSAFGEKVKLLKLESSEETPKSARALHVPFKIKPAKNQPDDMVVTLAVRRKELAKTEDIELKSFNLVRQKFDSVDYQRQRNASMVWKNREGKECVISSLDPFLLNNQIDSRNWFENDPLVAHYSFYREQLTIKVKNTLEKWAVTLLSHLGMSERYAQDFVRRTINKGSGEYSHLLMLSKLKQTVHRHQTSNLSQPNPTVAFTDG